MGCRAGRGPDLERNKGGCWDNPLTSSRPKEAASLAASSFSGLSNGLAAVQLQTDLTCSIFQFCLR